MLPPHTVYNMSYQSRSKFERDVLEQFVDELEESEEVSDEVTEVITECISNNSLSNRDAIENLTNDLLETEL
jgi:metal-responsive CopG/Arc/MetJ family transcriptional regulator